ncbi:MAG TPA: hypothetical protein VFS61_14400 [Anaerolineales bacterium]|nr:hypothetical protein [Anaerolineales bacterium]
MPARELRIVEGIGGLCPLRFIQRIEVQGCPAAISLISVLITGPAVGVTPDAVVAGAAVAVGADVPVGNGA